MQMYTTLNSQMLQHSALSKQETEPSFTKIFEIVVSLIEMGL